MRRVSASCGYLRGTVFEEADALRTVTSLGRLGRARLLMEVKF